VTAFNDMFRRAPLQTSARFLFWFLAAIISILALYPRLALPEFEATMGITQYFHHAFAYLTLVVVGTVGWGLQRQLIIGVTMGAIALELLQSFSPGRHVAAGDLLASLAGVVLGCAVAYLAGPVLRRTGLPTALVGSKRRDP
jgi:VanZ family protein